MVVGIEDIAMKMLSLCNCFSDDLDDPLIFLAVFADRVG